MLDFVIVGILVIVMAVLTYDGLDAVHLAKHMSLTSASAQSVSIDQLWNWQMITICFLFALIVVPIGYSLVVFRRRKGETGDGEHIEGNNTLEIAWTVIPLFVVLIFAYLGAYSLREINRVDPNAYIIKVKAQQFSWTFEYPDSGIVSSELHLPVNKQVVLKMESGDVIHSFWVPEFRIKQDVVPGRVTDYRVTPTLVGDYKVRCSELCGPGHYFMETGVIVDTQADYDAWVAVQVANVAAASKTPEGQGQILTVKNGCRGCHTIDGSTLIGPSWLGLYGSKVELSDGTTVTADEAYLKESIQNPDAAIVAGFPSPSPMLHYTFTDDEIANIIAYLQTLK